MDYPSRIIFPNYLLTILLTLLISSISLGQNTNSDFYVKQINVDENVAYGVQVKVGSEKAKILDLHVGDGISSGTLLQSKSNYTIVFGSNNYNDVIAESGARLRLNKTPRGENISVCQGKVRVNVKNITGFYYVRDCGGNITLASKSTQYSVDVRDNGVYYKTTEGNTQVYKKERLQLSPQSQNRRGNRVLTGVSIDDQGEFSGEGFIDPNNLPYNSDLNSFDQAIATYEQMLQYSVGNPDLELDENISLAYLYMDSGRYGKAIDKLESAINLLNEIDPYDSELGILHLDLAEALKFGGYEYESQLNMAIKLLNKEMDDVNEEIFYAEQDEDYDYANDLRSEMIEIQEDLRWAYSLQ